MWFIDYGIYISNKTSPVLAFIIAHFKSSHKNIQFVLFVDFVVAMTISYELDGD
jgi:hypothetical protein